MPVSISPKLDVVSVEQAAEILDCSTKTIRRKISRGELRAYRMGARLIRIKVEDLERLMRPIPHARMGAAR